MEFQSVEEIKEYFGITSDDIIEIRKELKIQIAKVHSDKTGGSYKSKKQEQDHKDLNNAIKFLDKGNDQIVLSKKDWDLVVKKLDDLVLIKTDGTSNNKNEYIVKKLDESVSSSIILFQKQNYFVKLSSTIIAGLLTILWAFPTLIEKHKILKNLLDFEGITFTCIWLGVILFTGLTWIFTKNNERKDELIKKRYTFEATQNSIFMLFIAWINATNFKATDYDHKSLTHIIYFTKDDLMRFIFNYYEEYSLRFKVELSQSDMDSEVKKALKTEVGLETPKRHRSSIMLFFNRPGEIDMDLAQKIADTIVDKLINKKFIAISDKKSFSETYRYDYKYF